MAGLLSRWRGPMNQQLEMPASAPTSMMPQQTADRLSFMGNYPAGRLGPMPQFGNMPIPHMPQIPSAMPGAMQQPNPGATPFFGGGLIGTLLGQTMQRNREML